jgi:hypothetical protein
MSNLRACQRAASVLGAVVLVCAAALPAAARNAFDGKWTIEDSSRSCMVKSGSWTLIVRDGAVSAPGYYPATGSISPTGVSKWTRVAKKDGQPVTYSGEFHGDVGSGAYVSSAAYSCSGEFDAKRQ